MPSHQVTLVVLCLMFQMLPASWVQGATYPVASSSTPTHNPEISMGTTLVALVYKHGVIVGADSRTSVSGYVSNRYAHKWTPITPHIIVGRSGSAADTQRLCEETRWELESLYYQHGRKKFSTLQVANLLRSQLRSEDLTASLLCVGCDDAEHDKSSGKNLHPGEIYSLSPSGALLKEDGFAVSGSGSTYIIGHMDSLISSKPPKDLEEDEAVQCVIKALQLAMDRDGSSGGVTRIHVLNPNGRRSLNVYPANSDKRGTASIVSADDERELPGFASVARKPQ